MQKDVDNVAAPETLTMVRGYVTRNKSGEWSTCEFREHGVQLDYPSSWSISEEQRKVTIHLPENRGVSLNFIVGVLPPNTTMDDLTKDALEMPQKLLARGMLDKSSLPLKIMQTRLLGKPARTLAYGLTMGNNRMVEQTWTEHRGRSFIVTRAGPANEFRKYKPIFDQVLRSIQFLSKEAEEYTPPEEERKRRERELKKEKGGSLYEERPPALLFMTYEDLQRGFRLRYPGFFEIFNVVEDDSSSAKLYLRPHDCKHCQAGEQGHTHDHSQHHTQAHAHSISGQDKASQTEKGKGKEKEKEEESNNTNNNNNLEPQGMEFVVSIAPRDSTVATAFLKEIDEISSSSAGATDAVLTVERVPAHRVAYELPATDDLPARKCIKLYATHNDKFYGISVTYKTSDDKEMEAAHEFYLHHISSHLELLNEGSPSQADLILYENQSTYPKVSMMYSGKIFQSQAPAGLPFLISFVHPDLSAVTNENSLSETGGMVPTRSVVGLLVNTLPKNPDDSIWTLDKFTSHLKGQLLQKTTRCRILDERDSTLSGKFKAKDIHYLAEVNVPTVQQGRPALSQSLQKMKCVQRICLVGTTSFVLMFQSLESIFEEEWALAEPIIASFRFFS
jgi:hypothetical protein